MKGINNRGAHHLRPLLPGALPAGDAGLAYGQAVLATTALARGREPRRVPEGGA